MAKKTKDESPKIVIDEGDYIVISLKGKPPKGEYKCRFRATFEGEPDGFRGFGKTKEEATKELKKIAGME